MRLLERNPRLSGLFVGLVVLGLAGLPAHAQLKISSTEPGSIVVFPKVIADGTRDTIISLTNTSNMIAHVHCEATNGIGRCVGSPDPENQIYYCNSDDECLDVTAPDGSTLENVGPCEIDCQPQDFELTLTAQQPTFWRVSTGRTQDPNLASGGSCTTLGNQQICPGFFLSPSMSPAGASVPGQPAFRGEVRCFQIDRPTEEGEQPGVMAGNALKGEAFIEQLGVTGEGAGLLSGYNSINIEGGASVDPDDGASLDGVEYALCPASLTFDVLAPGHADPISGADVDVEFTLVPCTFSPGVSMGLAVQFNTFDQLESPGSFGEPRVCWANFAGSQTGGVMGRSTPFLRTTVRAGQTGNCLGGSAVGFSCTSDTQCGFQGTCFDNACVSGDATGRVCASDAGCGGGICGPPSSILGVAETFYSGEGTAGTSAEVAHQLGEATSPDLMTFTADF
jgi:hypothetical protein